MPDRLLFDTDILIQYFRDDSKAVHFLEGREEELLLSTITIAELFTGALNEKEEGVINQFVLGFEVIPISEQIARLGGLLRREYYPGHGTGLADALIAATALQVNAILVTFNSKHYPMLEHILVPYSR